MSQSELDSGDAQGWMKREYMDGGGGEARHEETKMSPGKKRRNSYARDDVHVMVISELPSCCKALAPRGGHGCPCMHVSRWR